MPDERFGERVIAIASFDDNQSVAEAELIQFSEDHLAGYKMPRQILAVDLVRRAPNGKADYKWAKAYALEATRHE